MKQKGVIILFSGLGVLTLIVLVALFFFYPKESTSPRNLGTPAAQLNPTSAAPSDTGGTAVPNTFDPVEWTRSPQGVSGTASGPSPTSSTSPSTGTAPADGYVVTMNPPSEGAKPLNGAPSVTFPGDIKPSSSVVSHTQEPAAPEVRSTTSKRSTAKPKPSPVHKTVAKTPAYWIQVGAYKDRYQADQAAKTLEAQGLKGSLFTAQSAGQTIVRVRVGPYADKKEAEKFLAWVKPVKGMEGSFITVVHR